MTVRVVIPPVPIVVPSDLSGGYGDGDALASGVIAAVTETIDGPTGWLGRALGPQTLEWSMPCWPCGWVRLPCRPIIDIDSVTYLDAAGSEQTVDDGDWMLSGDQFAFRASWPQPALACDPRAVRIQYLAGYDGDTTGDVPERAKQAIILAAQHMLNTGSENLFLSVDEVEGVGRQQYVVSDAARQTIENACDRLLSGLRVFA
jgi:uncharacterized phiE125 gp8 family phage protein